MLISTTAFLSALVVVQSESAVENQPFGDWMIVKRYNKKERRSPAGQGEHRRGSPNHNPNGVGGARLHAPANLGAVQVGPSTKSPVSSGLPSEVKGDNYGHAIRGDFDSTDVGHWAQSNPIPGDAGNMLCHVMQSGIAGPGNNEVVMSGVGGANTESTPTEIISTKAIVDLSVATGGPIRLPSLLMQRTLTFQRTQGIKNQ